MLLKLSEKQLLIITVGGSALIAIILVIAGYLFFRKPLKKTQTDIKTIGAEITQLKQRQQSMADLKERIDELRVEIAEDIKQLPSEEEVSYEDFVDTLVNFSLEAQVNLFSVIPSKQASGSKTASATPTSYQMELEGSFYNLINFIYSLETYKRFIKVIDFKISPSLSSGEIKHKMRLLITTYTYKETAPTPQ
ncbi:MAG: type 4a pilus biogenesis protein PilO [Planctomycetes bacterium]|nr:type 4a pilus biogenesis protein PilO [Planctomycetota bacterium]